MIRFSHFTSKTLSFVTLRETYFWFFVQQYLNSRIVKINVTKTTLFCLELDKIGIQQKNVWFETKKFCLK